jgi:DNA-binding MarR family transcriptional regulator
VQRQRRFTATGIKHVAGDFALIDQRRDLRLRLTQAPRRPDAGSELGGLAAVGRIEIEIELLHFSHNRCISTRLIYVNMVDMSTTQDAPLGYLLYQVVATLRPEVAAALSPLGLTLPEFVCMRMLSMSPGMSSAQLSREGNVSPQAMNTVLHRLENAQVVTRPASVASGRALPATLTGSGRTLLKRAEAAVREADARVLAKLSAAEQQEFKRMLAALGAD